jgi:RNA polymerase sigma-70 factor (ECF subfamily)
MVAKAIGGGMTPAEFEQEVLPNLPTLMGVANRLTRSRSEAEDLVQDTFVKAFRSRDQYRTGTNLRAWLIAILRNTFLNAYRRRNLERRVFDGPETDQLAAGWIGAESLRSLQDPDSGTLDPLLEQPLLEALNELPPDFRMVVLLADVEELSYREIADSMGCPIGTVMSRLHRGRRLLRTRLFEQAKAIGLVKETAEPQAESEKRADTPVSIERYRAKREVG